MMAVLVGDHDLVTVTYSRAASGPYKVHWARDQALRLTFSDISFGTSTSMCLDLVSWVQEVHNAAIEVKTPLDIYLQRHSPLSPDLWLHYSRLSYSGYHDGTSSLSY